MTSPAKSEQVWLEGGAEREYLEGLRQEDRDTDCAGRSFPVACGMPGCCDRHPWACSGCGATTGRYDNGEACKACVMDNFAEAG